MLEEIKCKLVSLYKFTMYYNEDHKPDDSYTYIIIADTLGSLIKGIVNRELVWSMKDCRKYLEVSDFVIVPNDSQKRYTLHDIDHDISKKYGLTIESEFYDCVFEDVNNLKSVVGFDKVLLYLDNVLAQRDSIEFINNSLSEYFSKIDYNYILADALYQSDKVQTAIFDRLHEQNKQDKIEGDAGLKALEILKSNSED